MAKGWILHEFDIHAEFPFIIKYGKSAAAELRWGSLASFMGMFVGGRSNGRLFQMHEIRLNVGEGVRSAVDVQFTFSGIWTHRYIDKKTGSPDIVNFSNAVMKFQYPAGVYDFLCYLSFRETLRANAAAGDLVVWFDRMDITKIYVNWDFVLSIQGRRITSRFDKENNTLLWDWAWLRTMRNHAADRLTRRLSTGWPQGIWKSGKNRSEVFTGLKKPRKSKLKNPPQKLG